MPSSTKSSSTHLLMLLVFVSGIAALSWQVLWQMKAALALGVSAWGTAVTLAVTMGGMSLGSLAMGRYLARRRVQRPLRVYGVLEILIGVAGCYLTVAFDAVAIMDSWVYNAAPQFALSSHIVGIALAMGVPTLCMGATIPVFGLMARHYKMGSLVSQLYGLNTLGAAVGSLVAAFLFIPWVGVVNTILLVAAVNVVVGIVAYLTPPPKDSDLLDQQKIAISATPTPSLSPASLSPKAAMVCVMVTGAATFVLEIAWFRSLTSTFQSTTSAFAIMLSALLLSLGVAAWLTPTLKRVNTNLGTLIGWAGALILLATPLLERFDWLPYSDPPLLQLEWLFWTLLVIGPPVALLGVALPWLLDEQTSPRQWSKLYALNTMAAILGALGGAWLLLPKLGFTQTSWLVGGVVAVTGLWLSQPSRRYGIGLTTVVALVAAIAGDTGIGTTRLQGWVNIAKAPLKILGHYEGPDATVAVAAYENNVNALVINGFVAATELDASHYMAWMGHLPMLAHPDPQDALVICFGTGQTANAVRQENPRTVDIVDINAHVPQFGRFFSKNQNVLADPRVKVTIMDGRAYLRRTTKLYDVITLEPMPPSFAGVNALYSQEFYEQAANRLRSNGVIAQWLPFHLVSPAASTAIASSFVAVFPNAILWTDTMSGTGILLGSKNPAQALGQDWPGLQRVAAGRDLTPQQIMASVTLNPAAMRRYGAMSVAVTDDNQLLAYGAAVHAMYGMEYTKRHANEAHRALLAAAAAKP